jgi:hypothetical protein
MRNGIPLSTSTRRATSFPRADSAMSQWSGSLQHLGASRSRRMPPHHLRRRPLGFSPNRFPLLSSSIRRCSLREPHRSQPPCGEAGWRGLKTPSLDARHCSCPETSESKLNVRPSLVRLRTEQAVADQARVMSGLAKDVISSWSLSPPVKSGLSIPPGTRTPCASRSPAREKFPVALFWLPARTPRKSSDCSGPVGGSVRSPHGRAG